MKRLLAIIGVMAFGAGMFFAGYFVRTYSNQDLASLKFVLDKYKEYYLEQEDNYVDIMVEGLLDQYSEYYSKEEYEIIKKSAKGIRSGVGITVYNNGGNVYISDVKGNSPAQIAGVKRGGVIVGMKKATENEFQSLDYNTFSSNMDALSNGEAFNLKIKYDGEEKVYELAKREYTETYVFYADNSGYYHFTDYGSKSLEMVKSDDEISVE